MSRSFKKEIAWGKSTASKATRSGSFGRKDFQIEKAKKEGKPFTKSHQRYTLQTEQDYINMARGFLMETNDEHYERLYGGKLKAFLNGRELTEELAEEFGKISYKKDRSR